MNDDLLGCTEAGKILGTEPQAIHNAMKRNALKSITVDGRMKTTVRWLIEYKSKRYDRSNLHINGKLFFDKERGRYTVMQVAEMFGVHRSRIYRAFQYGKIKLRKFGLYYVIIEEDLPRIAQYLKKEYRPSEQVAG